MNDGATLHAVFLVRLGRRAAAHLPGAHRPTSACRPSASSRSRAASAGWRRWWLLRGADLAAGHRQIIEQVSHTVAYIATPPASRPARPSASPSSAASPGHGPGARTTTVEQPGLRRRLHELDFGFTHVPARGRGPVELVFTVIRRQHCSRSRTWCARRCRRFYSVEEVAGASERSTGAAAAPARPLLPLPPLLQAQVRAGSSAKAGLASGIPRLAGIELDGDVDQLGELLQAAF